MESTRKLIEQTIQQVLGDTLGSSTQGGGRNAGLDVPKGSEFYIAKTPSEGIPAADFESDPPKINSAKCSIWTIQNRSGELSQTPRNEIVWNLESSILSGDQFIKIAKDKFGRWVPMQGTHGSLSVDFRIVSSPGYCDECTAIVEIVSRPPGMSRVPEERGLDDPYDPYSYYGNGSGYLMVHDKTGNNCYLHEHPEDLAGRYGSAAYVDFLIDGPNCADTPGKKWVIRSLCCNDLPCESAG